MSFLMHSQGKKILERFIGVVEDEAGLYGRMPALLKRENQAVAAADRQLLCRITAEKEKLISRIRTMEEQRAQMLAQLSEIADEPRQALTLARLAELVDEPHAARIRAAGRNLSLLIRRIQDDGRRNKGLLEHHLQLVKGAIAFCEKNRKPAHVYHRTGELRPLRPAGKVFSGKI